MTADQISGLINFLVYLAPVLAFAITNQRKPRD